MPKPRQYDPRAELLETMLEKLQRDPYPSTTHLDLIEQLLGPDDVEPYVESLLDRIREDNYPSLDMIERVRSLAGLR